jgi:hypothetical protein
MSEQLEQPRPHSRAGSAFKRLRHLGNILMILLCGLVATIEVVKAIHGGPEETTSSFSGRMRNVIEGQLVKVDQIDPMQLATSFSYSLLHNNCKWIVSCEKIDDDPPPKIHVLDPIPTGTNLEAAAKYIATPLPPKPELLTQFGGFPIPTWHSINGAPRAAWDSAKIIGGAGPWAITMFLSCTIIWFVLLFKAASGDNAMIVYAMVIGCPLGISLMVWCVQHLCEAALHLGLLGCAITVGIIGALHSVALVLVVGFRHIMKTPRELAEEVKELKSV